MQNPRYAADFAALIEVCRQRNVAFQTIQSIARSPIGKNPRTYNMYFYEPLVAQEAIEKAVYWALGLPDSFVISAGDILFQPGMLQAAARFTQSPSDAEMRLLVDTFEMRPVFS